MIMGGGTEPGTATLLPAAVDQQMPVCRVVSGCFMHRIGEVVFELGTSYPVMMMPCRGYGCCGWWCSWWRCWHGVLAHDPNTHTR